MQDPNWKPYAFTTDLANNATQTMINVAGLTEKVYLNGALLGSYTTNSLGSVTFSWTPATAGQYNITTIFPGQSYYTGSSATSMVSVVRRPVVLAVASSPQVPNVNDRVTWNVIARDMINNSTIRSLSISQYIGGTLANITQTDQTGTASFIHTFSLQGSQTVSFTSAQNSTYSTATINSPITVLMPTSLVIQGQTSIIVGQQNSFTIIVKDSNANVLGGRTIKVEINGASYQNVTTNSLGQAQFNWRPSQTATYTITANFSPSSSSDFGFKASSGTLSVNVVPQSVTNSQTTSSGTQTINFLTAQGAPQSLSPGYSFVVTFPSLGWININIQLGGRSVQGSFHIWNEFRLPCVAWAFGYCIMVAPSWHIHFDASSSLISFSIVTDFFTGNILSASLSANQVWVDQSSAAFQIGQGLATGMIAAANAAYVAGSLVGGEIADSLGTTLAAAVWFGAGIGAGFGGFLSYSDKQSRLNYLGGILSGFGLSIIPSFFKVVIVINPLTAALWATYLVLSYIADPLDRPTLISSALAIVFGFGLVFELENLM